MSKNLCKEISYRELFWIFLKISAITFGGGYTIMAALLDELVEKHCILEEGEMLDIVAVAQSGPGSLATNASILLGYRIKGSVGAFVCALGSVIPSLVTITIVTRFYTEFRYNYFVNSALRGMSGVIAGVLVIMTLSMIKGLMREGPIFSSIFLLSAFIATYFFHINAGLVIIIAGTIGLILFNIIKMEDVR